MAFNNSFKGSRLILPIFVDENHLINIKKQNQKLFKPKISRRKKKKKYLDFWSKTFKFLDKCTCKHSLLEFTACKKNRTKNLHHPKAVFVAGILSLRVGIQHIQKWRNNLSTLWQPKIHLGLLNTIFPAGLNSIWSSSPALYFFSLGNWWSLPTAQCTVHTGHTAHCMLKIAHCTALHCTAQCIINTRLRQYRPNKS